ncbi:PSD1 and planctomycete cytochrome C domain-containing protein [Neorhodopirellula pilleata]|nr:PSD1 and planctomycete cytochrome C domain-containing protein [Neorhodopirellula pilleata]
MSRCLSITIVWFFASTLPISVSADPIDFKTTIEPVLRKHCWDCHGPDEANGRFRVDQLASLLNGGDSGEKAIVPGDPTSSFLIKAIRHQESGYEMPPDSDPIPEADIANIEQWITQGAKVPEHYGPAEQSRELTHWSFLPINKPVPPEFGGMDGPGGIDGFIQRKLAASGLSMSPQADRRVLIRRLFLIMHGLPPSPQRVEAFLADERPDAWERLVEEVLESPHYGERWATHWLDLVRFGETHGFETNRERPNAWPYRDWVIESFNQDKPYDEFVREQLAGDALGVDVATGYLVAGPFDAVKGQDPNLRIMQRMNELDDMINTTGTAFLGLTTGCARCHNHKFDPISQTDYYAMQAIFAGVQHADRKLPLPQETQQEIEALDAKIEQLSDKLANFLNPPAKALIATDAARASDRPAVQPKRNVERLTPVQVRFVRFTIDETNRGQPCIDELEIFCGKTNVALATTGAKATSSGDFVHPLHRLEHINDGKFGNDRSWIAKQTQNAWVQIELAETTTIDRIAWGRDRKGKYDDRLPIRYRIEVASTPGQWQLVASSADRLPAGESTAEEYHFEAFDQAEADQGRKWLAERKELQQIKTDLSNSKQVYAGTFQQPGPTHRLYRGEPAMPREQVDPGAIEVFTSLELPGDAPEQKRRLALADWITNDNNPLTARVLVNRLWQFHFGTGIVDTPSDFGRNGTPPSHPELLDWLASEFIESGWSIKHVQRLILQSSTWQQSNRPRADAMRVDAASRMLWRFPPRRLEAEGIRDSILSATGVLDLDAMGGPGFSAFEIEAENVRHYHAKEKYGPEDWRRMIYMTKVRQERDVVFGAFDCPDASQAVPRRSRSTTPLQALNLLNSRFVLQQAELFARRLESEAETATERVQLSWRLCYQRPATLEEVADAVDFIEQQGLIQFCRAMLNTNEFVFVP